MYDCKMYLIIFCHMNKKCAYTKITCEKPVALLLWNRYGFSFSVIAMETKIFKQKSFQL